MTNRFIDEIIDRVTMQDLLVRYHTTGKHSRTSCPFHNGKDRNFSYNDKVYQCWVCGAKGNVITFTKDLFNLSGKEAIYKLNYDFSLGLPLGVKLTMRQKQQLIEAERKRKEELKRKQEEQERQEQARWAMFDEWVRLDNNRRKYAPKNQDEPWHPLFVEALQKLDYQNYLLNCVGW